jgi:hypothetical protein
MVDSPADDEAVRRLPRAPLEEPREMKRAHVCQRAELGQSRAAVTVGVDVLDHAAEGGSGKTVRWGDEI